MESETEMTQLPLGGADIKCMIGVNRPRVEKFYPLEPPDGWDIEVEPLSGTEVAVSLVRTGEEARVVQWPTVVGDVHFFNVHGVEFAAVVRGITYEAKPSGWRVTWEKYEESES